MRRLAAALILAATPAAAAPLTAEQAADALSLETMGCAAAYSAGLSCAGGALDGATAQDFRRARDLTLKRAYALGRKAGLSDEALLARTDQARRAASAQMGGDCRNVSTLLTGRGAACKALVRDPEGRLRQITLGRP